MNVGDLIKDLQKYDNELPVSVHIESNLPFYYEVVGSQLESTMNVNQIFDEKKKDKDDDEDCVNLMIKINPR
jgi:hypothetical protein